MATGVIFDGDDTLWSTEQLYDEARGAAAAAVARSGLDAAKWEELEREADVRNVELLGHSVDRFPTSCVQAYEELCQIEGCHPDVTVVEQVRLAAQSVFERDAPVVPAARKTLQRLRSGGVRLALLTKGDPNVQERRLANSGLRDLFDVVQIVEEKSPATIHRVIARLGVSQESAWMVGNSIRSDILPALAAGLRAVRTVAHVWEYERIHDDLVDERVVIARTLTDVPDLISA